MYEGIQIEAAPFTVCFDWLKQRLEEVTAQDILLITIKSVIVSPANYLLSAELPHHY